MIKKETDHERHKRDEYLNIRKMYIHSAQKASDNLHKTCIILSTGGFIYTIAFIQGSGCKSILFIARTMFAFGIISILLSYYLNMKANEYHLKAYDADEDSEKCEKKYAEKKAKHYNYFIEILDFCSILFISIGIISVLIYFLTLEA